MYLYSFIGMIEEMELVLKFCSSAKYQKKYCALDILYVFVEYFIL